MRHEPPLLEATLLRRYQRFLADVRLPDDATITVHCPNSGSMRSCLGEGWPARLSDSRNPKRKLRYTLEMVHNGRCWIGVNTQLPNRLAEEALLAGRLPGLAGCTEVRREVRYGVNSRIDLLANDGGRQCYIEVKNVTLVEADGVYRFPDAVTTRGRKHLAELSAMVAAGHRAVMLFVIQRADGSYFAPATAIDPEYAAALRLAHEAGVEILPCLAHVSPEESVLTGETVAWRLDG